MDLSSTPAEMQSTDRDGCSDSAPSPANEVSPAGLSEKPAETSEPAGNVCPSSSRCLLSQDPDRDVHPNSPQCDMPVHTEHCPAQPPCDITGGLPAAPMLVSVHMPWNDEYSISLALIPPCLAHDGAYVICDMQVDALADTDLPWEWLAFRHIPDDTVFYHSWRTNQVTTTKDELASLMKLNRDPAPAISESHFASPWCMEKEINRTCNIILKSMYDGRMQPKFNSVFTQGVYGNGTHGQAHWANIRAADKDSAEQNGVMPSREIKCGFFMFPLASIVRRRALIIACSYSWSRLAHQAPDDCISVADSGKGSPTVARPSLLPESISDGLRMFDVLVARGWNRADIVVLVDKEFDRVVQHTAGCHTVAVSDKESATNWMGRMVSGLDSAPDYVSSSLFLSFSGHGGQNREFGEFSHLSATERETWRTEDDGMDEFIMLSDYQEIRNGAGAEFDHIDPGNALGSQNPGYTSSGMISDNDINSLLCEPVFKTHDSQLFMIFDCDSSGSCCDLPFQLDATNQWEITGEARRDEEALGVYPMPWDCGRGVVWSIAACRDGESRASLSSRGKGLLTAACVESFTSMNGEGAMFDFWHHVNNYVAESEVCSDEDHPCSTPTPVMSCSHPCDLKTKLTF